MSESSDDYIVAFDPEAGYCRLFRSDAEGWYGFEVRWRGNGLRSGYDAMVRLNAAARPTVLYHVCSKKRRDGYSGFRVFKGVEKTGWHIEQSFAGFLQAKEHAEKLRSERESSINETLSQLSALGVHVDRLPRLTRADRLYLEWANARNGTIA